MKCAIVTGASRGIGKAIAVGLAKDGFQIVVNYLNNETRALETVAECESYGVNAVAVQADVSDHEACRQLVSRAKETFGSIDVLVNNAGITKDNLLLRMKPEDFTNVIDANLTSAFHMLSLVTPIMLKQRSGRIINISSVVGIYGNKGQTNYAASKAGLIGMTKSAAKEIGVRGITVNAVAPGFIQTEMTDVLGDTFKETIISNTALKCLGEAEDIANAVSFLASDKARYITGQVIQVDGGLSL